MSTEDPAQSAAHAGGTASDIPIEPQSLEWMRRLVAIPSISGTSNLGVIELIEAEFARYGYTGQRTYNADQTRANLWVTVPAAAGSTEGGIVISGHTDVVPVEGQTWDSDPFTLRVEGSRAYGRGVCDMKGFLGVALWLLPQVARAQLRVPLHFAFSYDEEIGCVGAPTMLKDVVNRNIRPQFAIVGEPSSMRVISAHKGAHRGRVEITGTAKHASLAPHGVSAVNAAGEFITFFSRLADTWQSEGPFDDAFMVPYATGGVNFVRGGLQYNIVAEYAELEYDLRTLPSMTTESVVELIEDELFDKILPNLKARARKAEELSGSHSGFLQERVQIKHELLAAVPGLGTADDAPVIALMNELLGTSEAPEKVTYGTEAGQFQRAGIESVVCGPGDIAQAHSANEWIELEQLRECERFFEAILRWASQ